MSKTKIELVNGAYNKLRISGLTSSPEPEEVQDGLDMLEAMMAEFKSRNICSSYVAEEDPTPTLNSRLEKKYENACEWNLAVRLAPLFGKEPSMQMMNQARQSLSNWSARSAKVNMINPPNRMPRGNGNTFRFPNWVRFYRVEDNAPISCDTIQMIKEQRDSYASDFNEYVRNGESVSSYEIDSSNGITINSSSLSDNIVSFDITADKAGYQTVSIKVTTTLGRVNPTTVNINVENQENAGY